MKDSTTGIFRGKSRRFKWSIISIVLVAVVILVIAVPLAVILPKNSGNIKGIKSTVLVPLYIYPTPGAWDPLYTVVAANPDQNFTVVLNPNSGPGASPYTNDEYMAQVKKLNSYTNVQTVGYVRTGFGGRNISDVFADVSIYSGWNTNANATTGTKLAVHGIFFDEAPNEYSQATAQYMLSINQAVKNATGLLGEKTIIQNPGTIPDSRLLDPTTDYSVVFEGPYNEFNQKHSSLTALTLPRSRYSYVIHSIPKSLSTKEAKNFAAKASKTSDLFSLTDVDLNFYEKFGSKWATYIDLMPA